MKKWSKLLAVPMALALFAGCADQGTEEGAAESETETTEVQGTTEEAESSAEETAEETDTNEETDANTEASADGAWLGAESESGMTPEEAFEAEDLEATGTSEHGTTIEDIDMDADDWVEQAAEATDAVEGDTYVKLGRGVLTVEQIDEFLESMPVELTYADDNNQFIYYNHKMEPEEMLGARNPIQVGDPLQDVHPQSALQNVSWVINQLRSGETDLVRMAVPSGTEEQFVVHDYHGIYDEDGNYMGINEIIHDIQPHIDFYLEETGAELVFPEGADATSGATGEEEAETQEPVEEEAE